jgi:hypothetical protein
MMRELPPRFRFSHVASVMVLVGAVCLGTAAKASASPVTIGSFGPARINCGGCDLEFGSSYTGLRTTLSGRGDSIVSIATLSAASLAGVDVFYTSLLSISTGSLSAAEQAALVAWVAAGGTLFSAGDVSIWRPAYNTFLSPFGITEVADAVGGPAIVVAGPNPITNGPNGSFASFNFNTGSTFAGTFTTLATNGGLPFLVQQNFGLGQIVAVGDFNLFQDSLRGPNELALFLNTLDSAGAAAPVPEPASLVLLATGAAALRYRRRLGRRA